MLDCAYSPDRRENRRYFTLSHSATHCWHAQCDAWRPLRLPAVLVGDGRLGGISTTLAAADSLLLRGYDLAAVAVS